MSTDHPRAPFASLSALNQAVVNCRRCPRLVQWREQVAREKTRRFQDWDYWGKPVPGFGDPEARVWVIGLAPAAHGGNRTGRVFTGDRSGDWLFRALHRAGFANQPQSTHRNDGLRLHQCYVSAIVRCAPPGNKPTAEEIARCRPYLVGEFFLLKQLRVMICLGQLAYVHTLKMLEGVGLGPFRPRPKFQHGLELSIRERLWLIASYHPSQQNTFTGVLTEEAFDQIFQRARTLIRSGG
ncbi:MAG: uracil-DNA glycosylase [Calditrichaeota bacterium]|nr:uracil-DNA glycosylase [Calditrichota bacterium]